MSQPRGPYRHKQNKHGLRGISRLRDPLRGRTQNFLRMYWIRRSNRRVILDIFGRGDFEIRFGGKRHDFEYRRFIPES